jgi:hypothetical protein
MQTYNEIPCEKKDIQNYVEKERKLFRSEYLLKIQTGNQVQPA